MDYSKYANRVRNKLYQYGGDVIITRKKDRVYDKETHSYINTEEVVKGKGVLSRIDIKYVNGLTILQGDVSLMCVLDSEPMINEMLSFGGKEYKIIDKQALNPDGSCAIYYKLQLR